MSLPRATWRQVRARVLGQADWGAGHRWLDLELPGTFERPLPGQFVQVGLPAPSPVLLPRPMSVAAAELRRGSLVLGFLYAPVGFGTRALAALAKGAPVDVLGPLGHGFPLDRPGSPVLVAGGRGVAPLLFAAERLARAGGRAPGRRCEFLYGARDRRRLVGPGEVRRRIARAGGRLHLATEDGSRGFEGDVVRLLARLAPRFAPPLVIHACGPHAMLKAVAAWAIDRGVEAHVAMESVMACGTGVCRGCPLPRSERDRAAFRRGVATAPSANPEFAMCCTEGPVFEARALDWGRIE